MKYRFPSLLFFRLSFMVIFPAAFVLLACPLAWSDSFELKPVKLDNLEGYLETDGTSVFTLKKPSPQVVDTSETCGFAALVKKEPETYLSDKVGRGVFSLAGRQYAMVLDSTDYAGKGYDRIHVDLNGNGDLTDDPVIEALPPTKELQDIYRDTTYRGNYFPRIDLLLQMNGESVEYGFFLNTVAAIEGERSGFLMALLYSAIYRRGEVTVKGKSHDLILLDDNSNGFFSDTQEVLDSDSLYTGIMDIMPGDLIFIDPEEEEGNRFNPVDDTCRPGQFRVAHYLCLNGDYHEFETTAAGHRVKFAPLAERVGYVANPNPYFTAVLSGNQGVVKITNKGQGRCPVPPGEWQLQEYTLSEKDMTDELGNSGLRGLTYVCATGSKAAPAVKVGEGKTAYLPFGPPYKATVKVSPRTTRGGNNSLASLQLEIVGTAGEIVTALRVKGANPPRPHLTITAPDGSVVEDGHFKYG